MVAHRHVLALANGLLRDVARREVLRSHLRVWPKDLDLALHGDIPNRNAIDQPVVLGLQVAIRRRHRHLVVDADVGDARGNGRLVVRRGANARGEAGSAHLADSIHLGLNARPDRLLAVPPWLASCAVISTGT